MPSDQEQDNEPDIEDVADKTHFRESLHQVGLRAALGARKFIEFFGRHPFVTGLMALVGVAGFLIDRHDTLSGTKQVREVDKKVSQLTAELGISEKQESFVNQKRNLWWGRWKRENVAYGGGWVEVRETSSEGFNFSLLVFSGSYMGDIDGFAKFNPTRTRATFTSTKAKNGKDGCVLQFIKHTGPDLNLQIEQSAACGYFHGAQIAFSGNYRKEFDPLVESGLLNELHLSEIFRLTGKHYNNFSGSFQNIEVIDSDLPNIEGAYWGWPPGMRTTVSSLIVLGENREIWLAFTHGKSMRVIAHDRSYKNLPKVLSNWLSKFPSVEIEYL